jgi:hypothetical protein
MDYESSTPIEETLKSHMSWDQDEDINQEFIPHMEDLITYKLGSLTLFRATYPTNEESITFEDPQQR